MGGSYHSLPALPVDANNLRSRRNEEEQDHAAGTKKRRSSSLTALLRLRRKKRQDQETNDHEEVEDTSSRALSASPVSQGHSNDQSRMPASPRPTSQRSLTVNSPRTHRRKSVQESDTPRPRRSTSPHPRPRGDFSASPRGGKKKSISDSQRSERKSDSQRKERKSDSQRSGKKSDSQKSEKKSDSQRSERKGDRYKKGGSSKKKSSSKKKKDSIDDGEKIKSKKPSSKRKSRSLSTELKVVEELEKDEESTNQKTKARSLSAEIQVHGEQDKRELQNADDPKDGDRRTLSSRSESPNVKSKRFSERLRERLAQSESPKVKTKRLSQRLQERISRSMHADYYEVEKERGRSASPGTQKKRLSKKIAEKFELVSSLSAEIQVHGEQDKKELQTADDPKDGDRRTLSSRSESPNVKSKRLSQRLAERLSKNPPSTCDYSDDEDGATGSKKGKKKRFRKARSESPKVKTKGLSQRLQERISRSVHADYYEVEKERGRSASPGTQKKRLSKKIAEKFELVSFLSPTGRKAKTGDRLDSPEKRKKEKSRSKSPWRLKDRLRRSKSPGKHNQRLSDTEVTQGKDNAANDDEDGEVKSISPKSVRSLEEQSEDNTSLEEFKDSSVGVFVSPGRKSIKAKASLQEFRSSTVGVIVSPGRNSPKVMASPRVRKKTITEMAEKDSSATPATKKRPSLSSLLEAMPPSQPPQKPQRQDSPDSNRLLSHVHDDEEVPLKDSNDERQEEAIPISMRSMESLGSAGRRSSRRSSRSLASNITEATPDGHQSMWSMDSKTITPKTGNQQKRKVNGTEGDKPAIPAPAVAPKSKGSRKKTAPKMKHPSGPGGSTSSVEEPYVRSTPVSPGAGEKIKFNPRGKRPVTEVPVRSNSVPSVSSSGKQQREQSLAQKQRLRRLPFADGNKDLSSNPSFPKDDDDRRSSHALERKNSSRSLPAPPIRQNSLELIDQDKVPEMPSRRVSEFTEEDAVQERKYMESVREDEAVADLPGKAFGRSYDHYSDLDDESAVDSNNQSMFSASYGSFSASYGSLTLGGGESLSSEDTLRNRIVLKKSSNQEARKNGRGSILKQKEEVEKPGSGSKYSMVSLAPRSTISLTEYVGRIDAGPQRKSYSRSTRSNSPGSQPGS
jgi:hypothetical protein